MSRKELLILLDHEKGNEAIRLRLLKEFDTTDLPRDVIEFLDERISDSIITIDLYSRQIEAINANPAIE